jgi:dsRNA-specific ribonuclease
LVNESQLADLARHLDLGRHLLLGKGEIQSRGMEKSSLLANAMEAIIAAIYLDSGFQGAFNFIAFHFDQLIRSAPSMTTAQDYKSKLQEAVQSTIKAIPRYQVVEESGPDHDKTFCVRMAVGDIEAQGIGKSKKTAEQEAARKGLEKLEEQREPEE